MGLRFDVLGRTVNFQASHQTPGMNYLLNQLREDPAFQKSLRNTHLAKFLEGEKAIQEKKEKLIQEEQDKIRKEKLADIPTVRDMVAHNDMDIPTQDEIVKVVNEADQHIISAREMDVLIDHFIRKAKNEVKTNLNKDAANIISNYFKRRAQEKDFNDKQISDEESDRRNFYASLGVSNLDTLDEDKKQKPDALMAIRQGFIDEERFLDTILAGSSDQGFANRSSVKENEAKEYLEELEDLRVNARMHFLSEISTKAEGISDFFNQDDDYKTVSTPTIIKISNN